jgi:hypothetical protein
VWVLAARLLSGNRPGLDHDHRLGARRGAGGGHELAGVSHPFHVQQHRRGVPVVGQVIEHVAEVHVGHGAEGHQVGKPYPPGIGPVDHAGHHGAGLGHEGRAALPGRQVREAGVQRPPRHQHAQGVGADDAHQVRARRVQQLLLQAPALGAELGKPGADHHGRPGTALTELGHQPGHGFRRRGDHRQIGGDRQAGHVRVGQHPVNGLVLRVHGQHRPVETGTEEIAAMTEPTEPARLLAPIRATDCGLNR